MGEGSMRRSLGQEEKMLKLLFRIVPEEVHPDLIWRELEL
jgi:hypothetical protein